MEGKACDQWKKELDNGLIHYIGITLGQIQKEQSKAEEKEKWKEEIKKEVKEAL